MPIVDRLFLHFPPTSVPRQPKSRRTQPPPISKRQENHIPSFRYRIWAHPLPLRHPQVASNVCTIVSIDLFHHERKGVRSR